MWWPVYFNWRHTDVQLKITSQVAPVVKNLPANKGDTDSISPSGRSGEENGNPLQYCLENPMDGGAWQAIVQRVGHD